MVPKLERPITFLGYSIPQILILSGLGVVGIIIFQFVYEAIGFSIALMLAAIIIGIPAVLFRVVHSLSDGVIENYLMFNLFTCRQYLPGQEAQK